MTRPLGPYRPVVEAGGWLAVSGQVGALDGALVTGGVAAQTRQAVANLAKLLSEHGADLGDVVKTTVFMADIAEFDDMNTAYAEAFGDYRPARATIGVAGLPMGARVEIEAWAYRREG